MVRIKRGNFIFLIRKSDHPPRHVHVYRDREEILKWDLDGWRFLSGTLLFRVLRLLIELRREGRL